MSGQKRRRTETALPEIISQINTEINVRDRLAQTLQARIDWAIALKKVLENGKGKGLRTTPENFQALASVALINAELPAQLLFEAGPAATPIVDQPCRRPPPRPKATFSRGKPTFLYVNAQATASRPEHGAYLLLKCPVCSRTAFSSLQGLLNHARISHSIEWGTHDACIKACAVAEPGLDIHSGTEVGVGPSGIRPGLQTLFERAVGAQQQRSLSTGPETTHEDRLSGAANFAQSLGIHEGMPALAPFLGKEARRRAIKVYNEDVDIESTDVAQNRRTAWRMSFAHRHNLPEANDIVTNEEHVEEKKGVDSPTMSVPSPAFVPSSKSRFHFTARVTISDRSLFVASVSTPEGPFSRKWMIAVDNPSYAIPLSSVLKHVKVTPISGADTLYLPVPVVREPPYVVLGMSDTPFLARVEMVFNNIKEEGQDDSHNHEPQTTIIEHWVDLDPLKSTSVVLGEEQLLDIELDRLTEVKAAAPSKVSFESRQLWNDPIRLPLDPVDVSKSDSQEAQSEEHRLLLETAKRFPLIQQARHKGQLKARVPYKLVSSRSQFNHLILGRQQSIKWGRARAIYDSFFDTLKSAKMGTGLPSFSVADIYRWLEDNDSSKPREIPIPSEGKGKAGANQSSDNEKGWCAHCGFEEKYHQTWESKIPDEKRAPSEGASCPILQSVILPQLHVNLNSMPRSSSKNTIRPPAQAPPGSQNPNRVRLQSVDPALLSFVEQVVGDAHIPAFQCSWRDFRYPVDGCGSTRDHVENTLAPLAVLTQSLQRFLSELVARGTKQAVLEKSIVVRALASTRGGGRRLGVTVLTPRHIQSGSCILDGGSADG